MRRRAAVVGAAIALMTQVSAYAVAAPAGQDVAAPAPGTPMSLPREDPARGINTEDLRAPSSGPCLGLLEVVGDAASGRCTHGPDAAPADVRDVRTEDLGPEEAAEIVAAAPPFACDGDGTSGRRAHAIYAHTPDRMDRFGRFEDTFRAIIAGVQDDYRRSSFEHGAADPLVYRFTHTTPIGGSCEPLIDSVDLPASDDDDSFGNTVDALEAMGYTDSDRRYLVFVDANVECGIGHIWGDDDPSPKLNANNRLDRSPLFSRVDVPCWDYAETHELSHNIGAVQDSAPNASGGYHCNDERDIMCYDDSGPTSALFVHSRCSGGRFEQLLDCNGNDYFNPDPRDGSYLDTHWNTADSGWLFVESGGGGGGGGSGGDSQPTPSRPSVRISSPTGGSTMTAPVTVRGSVSDPDGDLDRVVVLLDGKRVRTLRPSGSWWSTRLSPSVGSHTIKVVAVDDTGRTDSERRTVSVRWPDLFVDDDRSIFESDIEQLARDGVTKGCNPPSNDRFCPTTGVTRGQMAAFLTRALDLPTGSARFRDTGSSPFRSDIAALARAGITKGCNPPANDRFCPTDVVTRAQMAAFLNRALELPRGTTTFRDTRTSPFRADVAALARSGITKGCNPPANDRFCPNADVTREQMAAFLVRGLPG